MLNALPGNARMGGPIKLYITDRTSHLMSVTSTAAALLTGIQLDLQLESHLPAIHQKATP